MQDTPKAWVQAASLLYYSVLPVITIAAIAAASIWVAFEAIARRLP